MTPNGPWRLSSAMADPALMHLLGRGNPCLPDSRET
jgi:hypothetical protein